MIDENPVSEPDPDGIPGIPDLGPFRFRPGIVDKSNRNRIVLGAQEELIEPLQLVSD